MDVLSLFLCKGNKNLPEDGGEILPVIDVVEPHGAIYQCVENYPANENLYYHDVVCVCVRY